MPMLSSECWKIPRYLNQCSSYSQLYEIMTV